MAMFGVLIFILLDFVILFILVVRIIVLGLWLFYFIGDCCILLLPVTYSYSTSGSILFWMLVVIIYTRCLY